MEDHLCPKFAFLNSQQIQESPAPNLIFSSCCCSCLILDLFCGLALEIEPNMSRLPKCALYH